MCLRRAGVASRLSVYRSRGGSVSPQAQIPSEATILRVTARYHGPAIGMPWNLARTWYRWSRPHSRLQQTGLMWLRASWHLLVQERRGNGTAGGPHAGLVFASVRAAPLPRRTDTSDLSGATREDNYTPPAGSGKGRERPIRDPHQEHAHTPSHVNIRRDGTGPHDALVTRDGIKFPR